MASTEQGPAKKKLKPDYKDTIIVLVGCEQEEFTVHTAMICAKSLFFVGAISATWLGSKARRVELVATEPNVFAVYLHWVYTANIGMINIREVYGSNDASTLPSYLNLSKAWILGDMLLGRYFCNRMIDLTLQEVAQQPGWTTPETLAYIWENTASGSKLRQLHIDICAKDSGPQNFEKYKTELPPDMIMEFAKRFVAQDAQMKNPYGEPSRYYQALDE